MHHPIHRCMCQAAPTLRLPVMASFAIAVLLMVCISSAGAGTTLTSHGNDSASEASNAGVYPTTSPTPINPSFPIAPRIPIEDLKAGTTRPSTTTLHEKDLFDHPDEKQSPYMVRHSKGTPTPQSTSASSPKSSNTFAPATTSATTTPSALSSTQSTPNVNAESSSGNNFSRKTAFEYMLGKQNEQGLDTAPQAQTPTQTPAPTTQRQESAPSSEQQTIPVSTNRPISSEAQRVGPQYSLDFNGLAIGSPLPQYGEDLAVVPADNTTLAMGLNGVNESIAIFDGHRLAHFRTSATVMFNFPNSANEETETLISYDFSGDLTRQLRVKIETSAKDGKTWAFFSLRGGQYSPDMLCGPKKIRWDEGKPKTIVLEKQQGALRFYVEDELVCGAPVSDSTVLRDFNIHMSYGALIYAVELDELPQTPTPSSAAPKRPPVEQRGDDTVYRVSMADKKPGDPYTLYGPNIIVMRDEQGKYLACSSKDGSNLSFPATTTDAFGVDILIRNQFPLSDRAGWTDRFALFTLVYKNGIKESFSLNVTEDENYQLAGRYFISRSGPNIMGYTSSTDWISWVNAVDFNEFKILKNNGIIRLFYNGKFIRNEPTKGDTLIGINIPLRYGDRLYDIIVASNLSIAEEKERSQ